LTITFPLQGRRGRGPKLPATTVSLDELQSRADVALRLGQLDLVRKAALSVLGRYRSSLWATRTLAQVFALQGRAEESLAQYRLAISVDPLDGAVYQAMVNLRPPTQADKDLPRLQVLLDDHWSARLGPLRQLPDSISISRLAILQARSRMWAQAIDSLRRALQADDSRVDLGLLLARCLSMLRSFEQAEIAVNALLEVAPDCLEGNVIAASLARRRGAAEESRLLLERAYACDPSGLTISRLLTASGLGTVSPRRVAEVAMSAEVAELFRGRSDGAPDADGSVALGHESAADQPVAIEPAERLATFEPMREIEIAAVPDGLSTEATFKAIEPEPNLNGSLVEPDEPEVSGEPVGAETVALSVPAGTRLDADEEGRPVGAAELSDPPEMAARLEPPGELDTTLPTEKFDGTSVRDRKNFPDFEAWFKENVLDAVETERSDVVAAEARKATDEAYEPEAGEPIETREDQTLERVSLAPAEPWPSVSVTPGTAESTIEVTDDTRDDRNDARPQETERSEVGREPTDQPRRWTFPRFDQRRSEEPIRSKLADLAETVGREPLNNGSRFDLAQELENADPAQAVMQYAIIVGSRDPRLVSEVRDRLENLLATGGKIHGLQRLLGDVCMQQGTYERAIECYSLAFDELRSRQITDKSRNP